MADSVSSISTLPPLLFASALSAYGLYLCKENITRLQQYEAQSEKAAEWSNTAAQRLRKTRTTQTSGTLSVRYPAAQSSLLLLPSSFAYVRIVIPVLLRLLHPPFPNVQTHAHDPRHHRSRRGRPPLHCAHAHGRLLEREQADEDSVRRKVQRCYQGQREGCSHPRDAELQLGRGRLCVGAGLGRVGIGRLGAGGRREDGMDGQPGVGIDFVSSIRRRLRR